MGAPRFDVGDSSMPSPVLALLAGQIHQAFERPARMVGGVAPETFNSRGPRGDLNSPAASVAHLVRSDLGDLAELRGPPVPADLAAAYGHAPDGGGRLPEPPGASPRCAAAAVGAHPGSAGRVHAWTRCGRAQPPAPEP